MKGDEMTDQTPKQDPLNPKFALNTDKPDIKGFLTWLFDPEVDEAIKKFSEENAEN